MVQRIRAAKVCLFFSILVALFQAQSVAFASANFSERVVITPETLNVIVWSPDQSLLATGNFDGEVYIRDAVTNQIDYTFSGHSAAITSLAWNPNGTRLASADADGTVRIWDLATSQTTFVLTHSDFVDNVIWSSDGSKILTNTEYPPNNLNVWDTASGQIVSQDSMPSPIYMSKSPDASKLAISTVAYIIKILDASTFSIIQELTEPTDSGRSIAIAWHSQSDLIATGTSLGTIRVWDTASSQILATLQANESQLTSNVPNLQAVQSLIFNSTGDRLSSVSTDGTVRVWETVTWQVIQNIQLNGPIYAAAFSLNGSQLAYGDSTGNVQIVDVPDSVSSDSAAFNNAEVDQTQGRNEQFYIIGYTDERITFYSYTDIGTLAEVGSLPSNFSVRDLNPAAEWIIDSRAHLSISPDGQYVAFTARRDDEAALFIYTVADGTLEQTQVVSSRLFPLWSPDSEALTLRPLTPIFEPSPFPETFVYERTSGILSQITNSPDFIETVIRWLPDSSGIVYATRCESPCGRGIEDFYFSDRHGINHVRLTNLTALLPPDTFPVDVCDLVWNPTNERWYFQVGCLSLSDRPKDRIFSTNLLGDDRQELELESVFPDELIIARAVRGIGVTADGEVYIGLETDSGFENDWFVVYLAALGQIDVVYHLKPEGDSFLNLEQVVFSTSGQQVALVGIDSQTRNQPIRIIDTTSGQNVFQHTIAGPNTVCGIHWLDDQRFVFQETPYVCNVDAEVQHIWLVDAAAKTVTNVSEDIPNLIGLLRQPEKLPSFAGVGEHTATATPSP